MTRFEDEIRKNGYIVYTNVGDSMMPLLRQYKDLMVIRKIEAPLKKYDAVLYKRPSGAYVLHRIVKVCGLGQYKIVGDNRVASETVPEEWIFGILTEIIRDGQHISVESDEYKAYLKKLPLRRFQMRIRKYALAVGRRVKRLFGKKD